MKMPCSATASRLGNSLPRDIRINTKLPGFMAKQRNALPCPIFLSLLQKKVRKMKRRIRKGSNKKKKIKKKIGER